MIFSHSGKTDVIVLFFTLLVYASSCKKEELVESDQSVDFSYFPLLEGHWAEYEVDSIVHYDSDDTYLVDTAISNFRFYMREEVDSSFMDGENQQAFVIRRYRRDADTLPWTLMEVGTAKITPYSAQEVENNIRFVRLEFPIRTSSEWNGNAYNYYPVENYSYESVHDPLQVGSFSFDSTVTVIQNDFVSQINRVNKKEVYGAQVGLLFKQADSVTTKVTVNGTIILNGLEYKSVITDFKQ
jgi:hypothetical protein